MCYYIYRMHPDVSREKKFEIINEVICSINPLNLDNESGLKEVYATITNEIVDIYSNRKNFFGFWKEIRDCFLQNCNVQIENRICKRIDNDILCNINDFIFVRDLKETTGIDNIKYLRDDVELSLTIHENFKVKWKEWNYLYINDFYYCEREEQDIEYTLFDFANDDSVIYVLYSQKYSFFRKSRVRVIRKDRASLDKLKNDNRVVMIFDNKSLIYQNKQFILKHALLVNNSHKIVKIYEKEVENFTNGENLHFLKAEKNKDIFTCLFDTDSGNKYSIEVYNPEAGEDADNYVLIGIADKIILKGPDIFKTFYLDNNVLQIVDTQKE